jgi:hypothetical protein
LRNRHFCLFHLHRCAHVTNFSMIHCTDNEAVYWDSMKSISYDPNRIS